MRNHDLELRNVGLSMKKGVAVEKLKTEMAKDAGNIIGRHMNTASANLEKATKQFEEAATNILGASDRLHQNMDALSKKAKDSVGRAKDCAAQMTDAMNKVSRLLGADFDARLAQLQALTDCLERLSALQQDGKLEQMMKALDNGGAKSAR